MSNYDDYDNWEIDKAIIDELAKRGLAAKAPTVIRNLRDDMNAMRSQHGSTYRDHDEMEAEIDDDFFGRRDMLIDHFIYWRRRGRNFKLL